MKKNPLDLQCPGDTHICAAVFFGNAAKLYDTGVEQCAFVYDVSFVAHQSTDVSAVLHACAWT